MLQKLIVGLMFVLVVGCTEEPVSVSPGEYKAISNGVSSLVCFHSDGTYSQRLLKGLDTVGRKNGIWKIEYGYGDPRIWMTKFYSFGKGGAFVDEGNGILYFGKESFIDGVDGQLEYKKQSAQTCN
jgi:hypothetical protein